MTLIDAISVTVYKDGAQERCDKTHGLRVVKGMIIMAYNSYFDSVVVV